MQCTLNFWRNNITVYAAHTNLDTANCGMNDWLADQLHLINTVPLVPAGNDPISGEPVGMGRVGELAEQLTPQKFANIVWMFWYPRITVNCQPA